MYRKNMAFGSMFGQIEKAASILPELTVHVHMNGVHM
jgi:hypothetical protein